MKMYTYGMEVQLHMFLASALVGGEWSASRPGRSTPGERVQVSIEEEAEWASEAV
jgi:hypothetical protein